MLEEHPFTASSSIQIDQSAPTKLYGTDQSHGGYIACVTRALMSHDVKRYRRTRVLFTELMDIIQGYRYDALDVLKRLCEVLWGYPILVRAFNESSMLPTGYRIESNQWNVITLRTPGGRVFRLTEDGFTQGTSGTRRAAS
ncbi:hypothetical protein FRC04_005016 [Tulasnella sp. 424]|nr:hypothetical protein FRC04_005016 [Tulasnella sp. 424]KAG8963363.1 hypothetical protein FRC05_004751 [Tulasnella sp. 425]